MKANIKILMLLLLMPFMAYSKKEKQLKIDLLNIVLVSKNDVLINDSAELSIMRNYFIKGYMSGEISDYHYADTIVSIIMNNKKFFIGIGHDDIEQLIGRANNSGYYDATYKMARWDMPEPIEKVVLNFQFKKGKVVSIHGPYISDCCASNIGKQSFWKRIIPRKKKVWTRPKVIFTN